MLVTAAVVLAPAATASAAVPVADTGAATGVGQTEATLAAKVNPEGAATSVRFDLGTSTAYGLQSASKDAGSGSAEVTVEIPVQGLTADTTYHFRVVATNPDGTTQGADATFKTDAVPPTPARPGVSTGGVRGVTPTAATLTGSVDPNNAATTYHFEYGPTKSYGASTPAASAGSGPSSRSVSAAIGGLQAGRTYHYRLVAENSAGTTRGGDRSFRAGTTPTGATLTASADPVVYGSAVTLTGKLSGSRVSGVRVRLQTTTFPFGAPFADLLKPVTTGSSGAYSFTLPPITATTRALVIADGAPSILSPTLVLRSAVRTGITSVQRARSGQVTVRGRLTPVTRDGIAALQRQTAKGTWVPLRRAHIGADGRYAIRLRARSTAIVVRTVGLPHDGGAHVRGTSRMVTIAARR